ncbi:MAG: HEAT repeat domain-containing protein [Chloroflexi bacterium]|nr:HEAT repeat domain-containing protein [Chloroflexota bacterium]
MILWSVAMGFALMLLPMTLAKSQPTVTESASALLRDASPTARAQGIQQLAQLGTAEAATQLITFFQRDANLKDNGIAAARGLATIGTAQTYQALVEGMRQSQPALRRTAAFTALSEAKSDVVPVLVSALMDTDPVVRANAAQLLGTRHATEATTAALSATYDPDVNVRAASAAALGEMGALGAILRMEQLQIVDTNAKVREAAIASEQMLKANVARSIGIATSDVRSLTVAPSNGQPYAVTQDTLYTLRDGVWSVVGRVPDVPLALAAGGDDGKTVFVYVGTTSLGLYRSVDGGQSWNSVRAGLPEAARLSVTALAVNPVDTRYVYMALASASDEHVTALGIFRSNDSGQTWSLLGNAPREYVTTRLVLDATNPEFLFGLTEVGAWRYMLAH